MIIGHAQSRTLELKALAQFLKLCCIIGRNNSREHNFELAISMSVSTLAILAGNAVTTWDFEDQSVEPFTFFPQDQLPLADVTWNHNGQGTQEQHRFDEMQARRSHRTVPNTITFQFWPLVLLFQQGKWITIRSPCP